MKPYLETVARRDFFAEHGEQKNLALLSEARKMTERGERVKSYETETIPTSRATTSVCPGLAMELAFEAGQPAVLVYPEKAALDENDRPIVGGFALKHSPHYDEFARKVCAQVPTLFKGLKPLAVVETVLFGDEAVRPNGVRLFYMTEPLDAMNALVALSGGTCQLVDLTSEQQDVCQVLYNETVTHANYNYLAWKELVRRKRINDKWEFRKFRSYREVFIARLVSAVGQFPGQRKHFDFHKVWFTVDGGERLPYDPDYLFDETLFGSVFQKVIERYEAEENFRKLCATGTELRARLQALKASRFKEFFQQHPDAYLLVNTGRRLEENHYEIILARLMTFAGVPLHLTVESDDMDVIEYETIKWLAGVEAQVSRLEAARDLMVAMCEKRRATTNQQ